MLDSDRAERTDDVSRSVLHSAPSLRARFCALVLLLVSAGLGCDTEQTLVRVDVVTDLLPALEFDRLELRRGEAVEGRYDADVDAEAQYLRGLRLGSLSLPAGDIRLNLVAFLDGSRVASKTVVVSIGNAAQVVTMVLSRNCRGVTCPLSGNPGLDSCLGGRCVDSQCTPETPEFCPEPACVSSADCEVSSCAAPVCSDGVCLAAADSSSCGAAEYCDGTVGCVPRLSDSDAGPQDGGVSDGAPDALDGGSRLILGPRVVPPTPLERATHFASPDGEGETCSFELPCSIFTGAGQANQPGDVLFLRGGIYVLTEILRFFGTGTAEEPITVESYPGEQARLSAAGTPASDRTSVYLRGDFYRLRLFEIRQMTRQGLLIEGTDNRVEGLEIFSNGLSGIEISHDFELPYGAFASRNVIADCRVHHNFDLGRESPGYANGGNADGIGVSNGTDNRIEHCLIYSNSDNGLDVFRATNTYFGYSVVHGNGMAEGEGHGISAGGAAPSGGTLVEHCISWANTSDGMAFGGGANVVFRFNTTGQNEVGFRHQGDTTLENNLSFRDTTVSDGEGVQVNNSWNSTRAEPRFVSEVVESPDFLRPDGGFDDMGAYGE